MLLEQSKSALSGNPAADKSEDLWKTFANWVDGCSEAGLSVDTTNFRYYVTPAKSGALISAIDASEGEVETAALLKKLNKLVAGQDTNLGWVKQLSRFLAAGDAICTKVIERCTFYTEPDPLASIRDRLFLLPEDIRGDYVDAVIGMARSQIDALIRAGKPRVLDASLFRAQVWTFIRRHNFSNVLQPSGSEPETAEIAAVADLAPLFVRQLVAIDAKSPMMISAISDYLRTTADKVHWAARGAVLEDSFEELNSQLKRRHTLICDEVDDVDPPLASGARGRQVYRRCAETDLPLDGQSLPSYFITGAFNCLAQERRLGWHADYLTLFPAEQ